MLWLLLGGGCGGACEPSYARRAESFVVRFVCLIPKIGKVCFN